MLVAQQRLRCGIKKRRTIRLQPKGRFQRSTQIICRTLVTHIIQWSLDPFPKKGFARWGSRSSQMEASPKAIWSKPAASCGSMLPASMRFPRMFASFRPPKGGYLSKPPSLSPSYGAWALTALHDFASATATQLPAAQIGSIRSWMASKIGRARACILQQSGSWALAAWGR
jgi:hypothetical protein